MRSLPKNPKREKAGEASLPALIADILVEIAQPADSARVALVGPFELELRAALERFSSSQGIEIACESVTIEQAWNAEPSPLFSDVSSKFDLVLLAPPFIPMRRLPHDVRDQFRALGLPDYVTAELGYLLETAHLLKSEGSTIALVSEVALKQAGRMPIRELILRQYGIDLVVLFPRPVDWDSIIRLGILKLSVGTDPTLRPTIFAAVHNWPDWKALKPLLRVYDQVAARVPLQVEMDRVGSSAAFSLGSEDLIPYDTLLPTQLYYSRFIRSQFDRYETVKLGEVAGFSSGIPSLAIDREATDKHIRLITGRCITADGHIESPQLVSLKPSDALRPSYSERPDRWIVREDDILVGRITKLVRNVAADLPRIALVPSQWDGAYIDSTVIRLRIQPENERGITPGYVLRLLRMEYELRPEFSNYVEAQWKALSSAPQVTPHLLQQLEIPLLPESIRELLGSHVDVVDIRYGMDELRRNVALLTEGLDSLKRLLSIKGEDVEQVINHIEDRIVSFAQRLGQLDVQRYKARLSGEILAWERLEEKSQQFLVTAEWGLANFEPGLDFAPVTLSLWKAVETELLVKLFERFRQWVQDRKSDIGEFLDVDLHDEQVSEKTRVFARFIQGEKLAIGQMLWEFKLVSGRSTIRKSPLLQAFKDFLNEHFAIPEFFLSKRHGLVSLISEEDVNRYRNSAAHTGVFDRDRAIESRGFIIERLNRLLEAINPE
jgi:hypothetical protein